jgi:hypothetical protein
MAVAREISREIPAKLGQLRFVFMFLLGVTVLRTSSADGWRLSTPGRGNKIDFPSKDPADRSSEGLPEIFSRLPS